MHLHNVTHSKQTSTLLKWVDYFYPPPLKKKRKRNNTYIQRIERYIKDDSLGLQLYVFLSTAQVYLICTRQI